MEAEKRPAVITHLELDVVETERRFGSNQVLQPVEASEQLVLAALCAQSGGEAAVRALWKHRARPNSTH